MINKFFSEVAELLVSGSYGNNQAQQLARMFPYEDQVNSDLISKFDWETLLKGPDCLEYFHVWEKITDGIVHVQILKNGTWWNLTELEGDMFLVPEQIGFSIINDIC